MKAALHPLPFDAGSKRYLLPPSEHHFFKETKRLDAELLEASESFAAFVRNPIS